MYSKIFWNILLSWIKKKIRKKIYVISVEGLLVFIINGYLYLGFFIISWMNGLVFLIGLIKGKKDLDYLI